MSTTQRSIPDFHDALVCEAILNLRKMTEASRIQAQAIEAQASMVDQLLEASRRYRGYPEHPMVPAPVDDGAFIYASSLRPDGPRRFSTGEFVPAEPATAPGPDKFTEWLDEADARADAVDQQAADLAAGRASVNEIRRTMGISPMGTDEFSEALRGELEAETALDAVPKIEIVEKPLAEAPPDTVLDASGRLIAAEPDPKAAKAPSQDVIDRVVQEQERRPKRPAKSEDAPELPIQEAEPAPAPESGAAPPAAPARPASPPHEKASDRILNHYAETGDGYERIAEIFDISQSTAASYISVGRTSGDKRSARGDELRMQREEQEEIDLKAEHNREARQKRDILFPSDDDIGSPAYVVDYSRKLIETPNGSLNLTSQWLRVMDLLKDRDEHPSEDVWRAARFTNERLLLKNLRAMNENLAQVKLYIVADMKTYQLCGLA